MDVARLVAFHGAPGTSKRSRSARNTIDSVVTGFKGHTLLEGIGKLFMAAKNPSLPWCETFSTEGNRGVLFQVMGQPYSKTNSRRLVTGANGRPAFIKSREALEYSKNWHGQAPKLDSLLQGRVRVYGLLSYASERPDLDEHLILDLAQGGVIENDRQVREKILFHAVDTEMPRAILLFEQIDPQML